MWSEKQIDLVENIYIGLWNSSVGGPKLKVFIDAVSRFTPEVVIESLEWIAKTQDKDLRPSLNTITQICADKMPKANARQMQPPPCDNGDEEKTISFREYFRTNKTVEVPPFMHDFLDDDDPRKKVKKQNGRNKSEEVGLPTNPFV